jgi:hypothetical protein
MKLPLRIPTASVSWLPFAMLAVSGVMPASTFVQPSVVARPPSPGARGRRYIVF